MSAGLSSLSATSCQRDQRIRDISSALEIFLLMHYVLLSYLLTYLLSARQRLNRGVATGRWQTVEAATGQTRRHGVGAVTSATGQWRRRVDRVMESATVRR